MQTPACCLVPFTVCLSLFAGARPAAGQEAQRDHTYRIPFTRAPRAVEPHVSGLQFLKDGRLVAAASTGEITLFGPSDTLAGLTLARLDAPLDLAADGEGRILVAVERSGRISTFDLSSGRKLSQLERTWPRALALHPGGKLVAAAGLQDVGLFELPTLRPIRIHRSPIPYLGGIAWSPDGTRLVLVGGDAAGRHGAWRHAGGRGVLEVRAHPGFELLHRVYTGQALYAVAHHPREPLLAAGGRGSGVLEISPASRDVRPIARHSYWISALAYSPDGSLIVSGDESCHLAIHRRPDEPEAAWTRMQSAVHHPECWIASVAWSASGDRFVVGCLPNPTLPGRPWSEDSLAIARYRVRRLSPEDLFGASPR